MAGPGRPRHRDPDEDPDEREDEGMPAVPPEPVVAVMPVPPTLGDAFRILCEAMAAHLEDDVPAQMHCDEIQSWYQNGPANYRTCWTHAILMLEGIVGAPLRG